MNCRNLSLTFQIGSSAMDFAIFITTTTMLYYTNYLENLNQIFLYLNGFTSIIFLTDFLCKITMSSLLYQAIQEKFVIDVGVNTINFPSSSSSKPKFQGTKSSLTTTPITYGGTFPIGKNQPPFLPEERLNYPPAEGCSYYCPSETKCFKHNSKSMNLIQFYPRHEDKGTSTLIPFYLEEERVKRKSPWTLSTLTNSRKIESRKQTTPITYSGTFAVNKDLVPITGSSPKASPRVRKLHPIRSAGNSPRRDDSVTFGNSRRLDHISEERVSMECSSLKSLEEYYSQSSILPGSVVIE
ncbi:hypothetical protein ABEB36_009747 [Hypothenemus hampei]|uniref:Uncharacterized protein n=1 Tax=Hypothenemus hampei TaxID=57062 RepID=A0ABD1EKB4_HYPHA